MAILISCSFIYFLQTSVIQFNQRFYRGMDFPKEYHSKKRVNPTISLANLRQPTRLPCQTSKGTQSKGKIRVDQYQYEEQNLLGQGYTSKVYLGRLADDIKSEFAIKVVDKKNISKTKQNLQLLKQQIQIHKQLDHPNIVKCYDIIEKNNNFYLILEYCAHGTLDDFIKKHQKLTESLTIDIMEQIISGYKYLIQLKVLHRDLKPPNILKAGQMWKICDFGFSVMGKKNLVGQINVGTPAYMAPEALERTFYSPKTDFFSLGVVCYETLFGVTPWQHKSEKILLQMMKQQKINQELLGSLRNKSLVTFITRCCEWFEKRRINLEEFENFSFEKEHETSSISKSQVERESSGKLSINKIPSIQKDTSFTSQTTTNTSLNHSEVNSDKNIPAGELFKENSATIERELDYATLISYLIENQAYMLFEDAEEKELFVTVVGKHAGYIIRRIRQDKTNYFGLKKWKQYTASEGFAKVKEQTLLLDLNLKEKLNVEGKKKTISTIRQVIKRFDALTYDQNLPISCLKNLKEFILQLMGKTIKRYKNAGESYAKENNWTAQVLDSLLQYYKYIRELCSGAQQSRQVSEISKDCKEHLVQNFSQSTLGYECFKCLVEEISKLQS